MLLKAGFCTKALVEEEAFEVLLLAEEEAVVADVKDRKELVEGNDTRGAMEGDESGRMRPRAVAFRRKQDAMVDVEYGWMQRVEISGTRVARKENMRRAAGAVTSDLFSIPFATWT